MEKTNEQHIVKSNNLIDCSYKLTVSEQRLINLACKKLKPMFVDKNISIRELKILAETNFFDPIEISVPEYKKEFKVNSNNVYKEMAKTTSDLFEKEIIYFDEDESLVRKRWVITCKFNEVTKKVILKFHPDLLMDLLIFKGRYTKLNYSFLTTTKSFYSGRVYELLRQYLSIGNREFELQDLRFKLGLKDSEYPMYANFKQKILKPSITWINENSDIHVEMIENKLGGRAVKRLSFKIRPQNLELNSPKSVMFQTSFDNVIDENSAYQKIISILNLDLTAEQVELICDAAINGLNDNKIDDIKILDYIKDKWDVTKEYSKNKKNFNYIGGLITALRDNWNTPKLVITDSEDLDDKTKLKFNNFKGRDYNYNNLEKMLLGHEEYDSEKLYNN